MPKESKGSALERKPLTKTATIAIRYLNQRMQQEVTEILEADAAEQGVSIADGWRFDQQSQSWARGAAPVPVPAAS